MRKIIISLFVFFVSSCNLPSVNRAVLDSQLLINLLKDRTNSGNNQSVESARVVFSENDRRVLVYNAIITISSEPPGFSIYYTTDGSTPTSSSTRYSTAITPNIDFPGKKIRAIAVADNGNTSQVFEAQYFYPVLKSGQNKCYNLISHTMETCNSTDHRGQDGLVQSGYSRSYNSFQTEPGFPADYITIDNVLGHVWTACNLGSTGLTCTGAYTPYNWNDAKLACTGLNTGSGYAGRTDWRLPYRRELINLLLMNNPSHDATIFPNTFTSGYYWVFDDYPTNASYGSMIGYVNWALSGGGNTGTRPVRCISGTPKNNSLTDLGNGTVLDNLYGLLWTKCLDGEDTVNCSGTANTHTYAQALNYCNTKNLDGRTWRLPNAYELEALVDLTATSAPYIKGNSIFSSGLASGVIHSSTTYPNTNTDSMKLGTSTGQLTGAGILKTNASYTFCVTNY